jgi:hypothetical protein
MHRKKDLRHSDSTSAGLRMAIRKLNAEIETLKAVVEAQKHEFLKTQEQLLAENKALRKEIDELRDQQENEKLKKGTLFEELNRSLERLKVENEVLRNELLNFEDDFGNPKKKTGYEDEKANEYAVPLNDYWNSLSLGNKMYDSLFSFQVDTPNIWPDPIVWNIIYAAVPPEYSIPDPEFIHELTRNVAGGILKPTLSRSLSYDEYLESFKDVSENSSSQNSGQTRA